MEEPLLLSARSLPLDLEKQVDRLCDEFEVALKSGAIPDFDQYLARIQASAHRHLLRELTKLLREYLALREQVNGAAISQSSSTTVADESPAPGPANGSGEIGETTRAYLRQSLKVLQEIDAAGSRFEEALARGDLLSIESVVAAVDRKARPRLRRELLKLEMEFRAKKGERPSLQEFQARFPEQASLVKYLFLEHFTPARIGEFPIERLLGRGGFGHVYQAWDAKLSRNVAIKVFRRDPDDTPHRVGGLLAEARTVAQLHHPGIVTVHAVLVDDDGDEFVVLEYVDGRSLEELLRSKKLGALEAAELMHSVCQALMQAHELGLVHRDLKPANILLDQRGRPRVTDFGLALHSSDLRRSPDIAGTLPYMAPEQACGETHLLDSRTDLWAVGVILYRCLCGWLPFAGSNQQELLEVIRHQQPKDLQQHDPTIPVELARIVRRCLAKQMSERYQSASELADDLHAFLSPAITGEPDDSTASQAPVIPRGLRPFDERDCEFFLQLLPGPRDRRGIPDSVRFWVTRLRELSRHRTFRVGLLYGPSGSGKSSIVHAGILPRLGTKVHTLMIEARRDELEVRLANELRERFGCFSKDMSLTSLLAEVREGRALPSGEKLLIVVDQFEQWLHGWQRDCESELIAALRQCDGGRVQSLLLVRDDFWTPATRLFKKLDVPLLDGTNAAAVDLFDVPHAVSVLSAFGAAFGRLPTDAASHSQDQRRFLERAAHELAHDGSIVPVRLCVFAEMAKSRPWTSATLRSLGGAKGLDVAFLEEVFDSSTAAPVHRHHRRAARRVLEQLLPPPGSAIRGHLISEDELRNCSGYADDTAEFAELMACLDHDLRLITPIDSSAAAAKNGRAETAGTRMYQLTHDFLVTPVRNWLNQTRRRTIRGRTELRLAEAAIAYALRPEIRQLPSWWEWLGILVLTHRRRWKDAERTLMRAASRQHAMRCSAVVAILVLLGVLVYAWTTRIRARGLVDALATSDSRDVPAAVDRLTEYRRWVIPIIHERFAGAEPRSDEWTRLMLGNLALGDVQPAKLKSSVLHSDPPLAMAIVDVANRYGALQSIAPALADVAANTDAPRGERLRACVGLAQLYGADDSVPIPKVPADGAGLLLQEVAQNPRYFDLWVDALAPLRRSLIEPLSGSFADPHANDSSRMLAAEILARYAADNPQQLVELTLQADPRQFPVIAKRAIAHAAVVRSALEHEVALVVSDDASEDEKDRLARRRANVILLLNKLNDDEHLWPTLQHRADPRLRTFLLQHFRVSDLPEDWQIRLANDPDPGIRQAIALAVGIAVVDGHASAPAADVDKALLRAFTDDPDAGVHSAAEWALRATGYAHRVDESLGHLAADGRRPGYRWYITKSLITMIVIDPPGDVVLGSAASEPNRDASDESPWKATIDWRFAISATEITRAQYDALRPDSPVPSNESAPDARCPASAVSAIDAEKFCELLAAHDGLVTPERDQSTAVKNSATAEDYPRSHFSYRLPTEAEWEVACRAGTVTPRYFGYCPELLSQYACFIANSGTRTWTVGQGIPNAWGFFDMLGNVSEWCDDVYVVDRSHGPPPRRPAAALRPLSYLVVRGSDFNSLPGMVRSANRRSAEARGTAYTRGFRIARTIPVDEFRE